MAAPADRTLHHGRWWRDAARDYHTHSCHFLILQEAGRVKVETILNTLSWLSNRQLILIYLRGRTLQWTSRLQEVAWVRLGPVMSLLYPAEGRWHDEARWPGHFAVGNFVTPVGYYRVSTTRPLPRLWGTWRHGDAVVDKTLCHACILEREGEGCSNPLIREHNCSGRRNGGKTRNQRALPQLVIRGAHQCCKHSDTDPDQQRSV
jgi:hypothetical protein